MSLSSFYSSNVRRKKEELARLKKDRVKYVSDISSASQKITRLSSQIKNTKSLPYGMHRIFKTCFRQNVSA